MEKQRKSKNKILKFLLPKPASAVSFQFSPGRDKRSENHFHSLKAHVDKGFSGPIVSIIPDEVRRKPKNGNVECEEPTSPKVSCMGQIKLKKMVISKAKRALPQETKAVPSPRKINKHASTIKKLFSSAKPTDRRRSNASIYEKQPLSERAPALSRDTFASIDWTDHISPVDSDHRGYYSDGEEEEEEVIIPFSAPIIIGPAVALQPRKEVNLWKRRAMNPPRPLQLNLIRAI